MGNKSLAAIMLCATILAITNCDEGGVNRLPDGRTVYTGDTKPLVLKSQIDGLVIDAKTKKGIKSARIEMKNANMGVGYYERETDGGGRFRIDDFIPHVTYRIEITATGYVTHVATGPVTAGEYRVELRKESILEGIVKSRRGEPLKGIEVKLIRQGRYYERESGDANEKPLISATNENGSYRFEKLPAGSYIVAFSGAGYITETARIKNIKEGESFALPMIMTRPAMIEGTVMIEGLDIPAIGVDVSLSGGVTYSGTTFQDGSFRLEDVKPGTYKVSVTHQGFYTLEAGVMKIDEGERKSGVRFTVRAKEPQVQVYAYRYTFAPGDTVEFNVRSLRLENISVTIYKVPIDVLVKGGVDPDKLDPSRAGLKAVASWKEPIREFEPYEWRYQSLQVKTALPTGGYCVEVKGADRIISRKFFSLTTVGVVMKRSQESILAYVTSLVDNAPVKGARVGLFDTTPKKKKRTRYKPPERLEELPVGVVAQGVTDGNGIFKKNIRSGRYLSAIVIAPDGSYAICATGSPSTFQREQKKYFIYTDRPVYRAGDTVKYKIIAKNRVERFLPARGEKVFFSIVNRSMDKNIREGSDTLDEWGTLEGEITIPGDANLGTYEIAAGPAEKQLYARGTFYVEQYRKPEFKVDITPSREYFINGDTAEFKVESKYFFGAPLGGALVRYRFYETRLRDSDTTYWWEEDYAGSGSYNRIVMEGEKYADRDGITVLRLHAGDYPFDREITCEATVVDRSNVSITSRTRVRVGRGEFYIKIEPSKNFFAGGEAKKVTVRTLTHTGKPYAAKLKVEAFRYVWKPWQRVYVHDSRPVYSRQISTNHEGSAVVDLPREFTSYGEFDLVVTGVDRKENVIRGSRVIWIYGGAGQSVASRFKNLEVSVSAEELSGPGQVTCLVKSRYTDAYVCITLEGRDVYETRVVKMTGNIMPVEFKVKKEYAPNLYVTATMQRKRALYTSTALVSLPVIDTGLSLSIETDREKYGPGETTRVLLKARDEGGRPIKADISLAAVDEAIFSVRRDHTPPMKDFFYSRISNWVLTSYSYPITVLAGAAKDDRVEVREKFKDTAFWRANIRTGDDGVARLEIPLPDNLTTWRLTGRGHDLEGRVGEVRRTFLVTQDLIARIGRPRFMVEGDRLSLVGIVNSNTERGLGSVSTLFKAAAASLKPEDKVAISLPAFGSASTYYPFDVPKGKESVALEFEAKADREARDVLRVRVPVKRRGVSYSLFGTGDMGENRTVAVAPIGNTDDYSFVPEELVISVNPSPVIQMLRAAKFLSEYPYGCVEQTLNAFMPNLALQRMLGRKGYTRFIDQKAREKLLERASAGLARIQQMQNDDGTWGWWAGGRGNAFVTGYVLFSLHIAGGEGFTVDKNVVAAGLNAVKKYFANNRLEDHDAVGYLMYVNALWGGWNHATFREMMRLKERSTYATIFLVRALAAARLNTEINADMRNEIGAALPGLVSDIKTRMKKDGKGLYWESDSRYRWGWQGGDTEMTAHALSALLESGDRSTVPSQIVRSLGNRYRGGYWNSTKETATVMLALCGYLEKMGGEGVTKGRVEFSLDGARVADIAYDLEELQSGDALVRKVSLSGTPSRSLFTVRAEGEAGTDLSFDVTISGTLYFKEGEMRSRSGYQGRSIASLSNGIKLTRSFSAITRVRDAHNREYLVPQDLGDDTRINVGDELMVKVGFTSADDFEYMVLEDCLPSGFEVTRINAYDEYQPYIHVERWDDRMVYFFTGLRKGQVYEVAYIMRAELPGFFMAKPARMECMYEPSIQGWSKPAVLEVKKK